MSERNPESYMLTPLVNNLFGPAVILHGLCRKVFSIKEMEHFSGIKAHTIRIWELRYRLFKPQRSHTNIRSYSLQDLRRLLTITLLLNNGYKISKIAAAEKSEIEAKAHSLKGDDNRQRLAVNHLVFYMYTDIEKFEDTLDSCVLYWGIDATIKEVILPFMEKTELLSYKDKSFETHFVVTALRKKLIVGIESEKNTATARQTALLFLAQGEHYDLFLLYMTYILKKQGVRILYLGTDISEQSLKNILEIKKPDLLYTYIPQKGKFQLTDFAIYLQNIMPAVIFNVISCEPIRVKERLFNLNFLHYTSIHAMNGVNVH